MEKGWGLHEWRKLRFTIIHDGGDESLRPNLIWETSFSPFSILSLAFCFGFEFLVFLNFFILFAWVFAIQVFSFVFQFFVLHSFVCRYNQINIYTCKTKLSNVLLVIDWRTIVSFIMTKLPTKRRHLKKWRFFLFFLFFECPFSYFFFLGCSILLFFFFSFVV